MRIIQKFFLIGVLFMFRATYQSSHNGWYDQSRMPRQEIPTFSLPLRSKVGLRQINALYPDVKVAGFRIPNSWSEKFPYDLKCPSWKIICLLHRNLNTQVQCTECPKRRHYSTLFPLVTDPSREEEQVVYSLKVSSWSCDWNHFLVAPSTSRITREWSNAMSETGHHTMRMCIVSYMA